MAFTEPLWKSADVNAVPARHGAADDEAHELRGIADRCRSRRPVGISMVVRSSATSGVPSATSRSAVTTETVCGVGGFVGAGLGSEHEDAAKGHHGQQDAQQEHQAVRALQVMVSTMR